MQYSDFLGLAGVPIIAALVQALKGYLPSDRYNPLLALVLGVALNVGIAYQLRTDVGLALIVGVVAGLSASGLYSYARTAITGS
jgi:hypothetical protein